MLLAGDELGKTQNGSNNCYCQDNEISWLQWDLNDQQKQMLDFVRGIVAIRKTQPVFRRQKFFQGRSIRGGEEATSDVAWLGADGNPLTDEAWNAGFMCVGLRMDGELIGEVDEQAVPIRGDTVLLLFNCASRTRYVHAAESVGRLVLGAADGHGPVSRPPFGNPGRNPIRDSSSFNSFVATIDVGDRR